MKISTSLYAGVQIKEGQGNGYGTQILGEIKGIKYVPFTIPEERVFEMIHTYDQKIIKFSFFDYTFDRAGQKRKLEVGDTVVMEVKSIKNWP